MRHVIFVQSKFPASDLSLRALMERWEAYAAELKISYGQSSIEIFSPFTELRNVENFSHLSSIAKSRNFCINFFRLVRRVNNSSEPFTLVCGDNQFSMLISLICRLFFPRKILIQCQFHGDIYSQSGNKGIKGMVRSSTSRLALRFADSVRIVSKFQECEIRQIYPYTRAKFILAPIPIDLCKIPNFEMRKEIFDVAIVGRLHYERGVRDAVLIVKQLLLKNQNMKIVFVGSGVEKKRISYELRNEILNGTVTILGVLSTEGLKKIYAESRVLLSPAPREGYGLTLREACLSGLAVVARNSAGSRQTALDFHSAFYLFNSVEQGVAQVLKALKHRPELVKVRKWKEEQQERDREGLNRLLESWVCG